MIPDELEALVLADSVGALDPDERLELQARLDALTPDEQSEVARLYDAATAVALASPRWSHPRTRARASSPRFASPRPTRCGQPTPRGSTPGCSASVPGSWPWIRHVRSSP